MPLTQEKQRFTYADYYSWDDGERWELIDGEAYVMEPGPSLGHQRICGELFFQITSFLKGKSGMVIISPFDVRLNADTYDDTVVQPDIIVVCDESKLDGKCCKGVPDMAVEILSPSTARHDRLLKFQTYQRAGVREYWIVDPESRTVTVYTLENGKYIAAAYGEDDVVPVSVLEGCEISMPDVFSQ